MQGQHLGERQSHTWAKCCVWVGIDKIWGAALGINADIEFSIIMVAQDSKGLFGIPGNLAVQFVVTDQLIMIGVFLLITFQAGKRMLSIWLISEYLLPQKNVLFLIVFQ